MAEWPGSAPALHPRLPEDSPLLLLRPRRIRRRAQRTLAAFPGEVLYAVKCNDAPEVLRALFEGGVRGFDVASIAEVRKIRELFGAAVRLAFVHPVKSPGAIREAWARHGVRRFAFDHADELDKILACTDRAPDLELLVRIAVPSRGAALPLSGKFGAAPAEAVELLRRARPHARMLGLTFHVGSQCIEPQAFADAIELAGEIARRAGGVDHVDVGGGFPARYRGDEPDFVAFVRVIRGDAAASGGRRSPASPGDCWSPTGRRSSPGSSCAGGGRCISTTASTAISPNCAGWGRVSRSGCCAGVACSPVRPRTSTSSARPATASTACRGRIGSLRQCGPATCWRWA